MKIPVNQSKNQHRNCPYVMTRGIYAGLACRDVRPLCKNYWHDQLRKVKISREFQKRFGDVKDYYELIRSKNNLEDNSKNVSLRSEV